MKLLFLQFRVHTELENLENLKPSWNVLEMSWNFLFDENVLEMSWNFFVGIEFVICGSDIVMLLW